MPAAEDIGFPDGPSEERELLPSWLSYPRGAVQRKLAGISDEQATMAASKAGQPPTP